MGEGRILKKKTVVSFFSGGRPRGVKQLSLLSPSTLSLPPFSQRVFVQRISMPVTQALFHQWDGDTYAKRYHSREITLFENQHGKGSFETTTRQDYPQPPLYWSHTPKPQHVPLPGGPFTHTTTYRVAYTPVSADHARPVRPAIPKPQFHPKLDVRTESRTAFLQPPPTMPPRPKTTDVGYRPNTAPLGTTTMRADYLLWDLPPKHVNVKKHEKPRELKFQSQTTTRNDYNWPSSIVGPRGKGDRPEPFATGPFDSTTTYRASYEKVPLPAGMKCAIGLQVATKPYAKGGVGGQFHQMIAQGTPAPVMAQKTFTTVVDKQENASVIVLAKAPGYAEGIVLGAFSLDGIRPTGAGVPKLEITLSLVNEKTLMASATYKNGQAKKSLTFQAARKGPALRGVASEAELD